MPKFFRTLLLVLCALTAMSVELHALNASASGLPTHEVVVYAPFSDGQVLQMAAVSAPSFNNVNSMLNRKVSSRGNYNRNTRNTSSGSYGGSVISKQTRTVRTVGATTNSRGGSYSGSTTTRRGATYSATGGAADRLGVANVVRTTTSMRGQAEDNTTTNSTPNNGLGTGENDLIPGQLPDVVPETPIGDAILPLLLMLSFYAAYCFIRRKKRDNNNETATSIAAK